MTKVATKKIIKIEPSEWYSLQDIVRAGMFPWARSFWSVRNIVNLDRKNTNILRAMIAGTGRGTKYQFQGENIIQFIKAVEAGQVRL